MSRVRSLISGLTLTAAVAACGPRAHLDPDHGEATTAWNARQRVEAQAASGKPGGLDSEEAAIIHESYRASLGADCNTPAPEQKVLLIETSQASSGGQGSSRGTGAKAR